MTTATSTKTIFFGWWVTCGAFVHAVFIWGIGLFGPPIFLGIIHTTRGWSLGLVSTAITLHLLVGAIFVTQVPAIQARIGVARLTMIGVVVLALGTFFWTIAAQPWQLFLAAIVSGIGWSATSAATVNAIIAPWFVRLRPAALGTAYNGASIGGLIFSPLWVAAIGALGFPGAAAAIGLVAVVTVCTIAATLFSRTPQDMGLRPDGDAPDAPTIDLTSPHARPLPGALLWRDRAFLTLSAGNALGLFAQIGMTTHLFSMLLPALGAQRAAFAMSFMTLMAIVGRSLIGRFLPIDADRRIVASVGYGCQIAGSLAFLAAGGSSIPLLLGGIVLFGVGYGNATTMAPLIAQVEFVKHEVLRVVALVVACAQAMYALGPAAFGFLREITLQGTVTGGGDAPWVFGAAAFFQILALIAMLAGRKPAPR